MTSRDMQTFFPDVPRETWSLLEQFSALVQKWQRAVNLVSARSLPEIWHRHIFDSLQLTHLAPLDAKIWVDLGSGGGFPGIVVAISRPDVEMHLVESDQRKSAFLREAARILAPNARIHACRAQSFTGTLAHPVDVVSARALTTLSNLLELAYPMLKTGAVGLFPKGQDVERELTEARKSWMIQERSIPSMTDPQARILVIESASPVDTADR